MKADHALRYTSLKSTLIDSQIDRIQQKKADHVPQYTSLKST